jgi:NAD(P)-dependent dehydrogenase (short-subunit alcohol dehydrogenase family)
MSNAESPVALVTGASSGIGRATAHLLSSSGWRVFATVRTSEAQASLSADASVETLRLDVTDEGAVHDAVRGILDRAGRIDALVNNAGFALIGAVEDLDRDTIRHQFEVNVFSAMQLCREVLPSMRARRSGRIVNVSSLAGRVSVPMMGAYCASKFALEAFTDALRVESRPFGIRVSLVEPGPVRTEFQRNAIAASQGVLTSESVFRSVYQAYLGGAFETGAGASAQRVAHVIRRALTSTRPRSRYRVRWIDSLATGFITIVPRGGMDWVLSRWMDLGAVRRSE